MKQKNNYLDFIAYAQVIGIILVVAGHSIHQYPGFAIHLIPYRMLYSFHMPLFIFISGFLMAYTTDIYSDPRIKPGRFVLNKIKRLLLPMAVLTVITFVPRSIMSGMADDPIEFSWHSFLTSFYDRDALIIPTFWYLQASFVILSLTFCIMYAGRKLRIAPGMLVATLLIVFIAYSLSSLPDIKFLSIEKVKELGMFFILGCGYALIRERVDRLIPWEKTWFLILTVVLWAACFYAFEFTVWWPICSLLGIMMCISLAKILEDRNLRFLDHLKGATYLIFLLSWYFNVASQQVLSHFVALPWWCYSILSLITGIYVPWLAYRYLSTHRDSRWVRVTSLLLGQG